MNYYPNSMFLFFRPGSYDDEDAGADDPMPTFRPKLVPGVQLFGMKIREDIYKYLFAVNFFKLFFTEELVDKLCEFTNNYAREHRNDKPSLSLGWCDVTPSELYVYIALLFYMSIVKMPNIEAYWSTATLYHGTWARAFMSKIRYKQISGFLKTSNFETEDANDKLTKVRFLHDYIRRKSMKLFQPREHVSIDERMVRNKGRFSYRQYIKDKPTKWGFKIWVIADALSGYTYDFEVYLGKAGTPPSKCGLGYDVVMRLMKSLFGQGYKLFLDNYYTSVRLFIDLRKYSITACGTISANRKGFPKNFKDIKVFNKESRGTMRWLRENNILFLQWRDNKSVSFISSMHNKANENTVCTRRTKKDGKYSRIEIQQPTLVNDYNKYMSGVDKSDQLIGKYESIRKTHKYWKTLFYHLLDIARVNSYILFQDWRSRNTDIPELKRSSRYAQLDFTLELIKQLAGLTNDSNVPIHAPCLYMNHNVVPKWSNAARNCKRCYRLLKKEVRSKAFCGTCQKHFCFNKDRNCLLDEHQ